MAAPGRPDEVRPHFAFGQHDGARTNGVERAAHEVGEVHRSVDGDPPISLPPEGESVGGGCGAGNDEVPCGVTSVEFVQKFKGDEQFADTDGMDPDPFTAIEARPQFRGVARESLPEIMPVASPVEHACQVAWQDDEKGEGKEKIVKNARHASGVRRYIATQACP